MDAQIYVCKRHNGENTVIIIYIIIHCFRRKWTHMGYFRATVFVVLANRLIFVTARTEPESCPLSLHADWSWVGLGVMSCFKSIKIIHLAAQSRCVPFFRDAATQPIAVVQNSVLPSSREVLCYLGSLPSSSLHTEQTRWPPLSIQAPMLRTKQDIGACLLVFSKLLILYLFITLGMTVDLRMSYAHTDSVDLDLDARSQGVGKGKSAAALNAQSASATKQAI